MVESRLSKSEHCTTRNAVRIMKYGGNSNNNSKYLCH